MCVMACLGDHGTGEPENLPSKTILSLGRGRGGGGGGQAYSAPSWAQTYLCGSASG